MNKFMRIVSAITLLVFLRVNFALAAEQVYFYYTDPAGTPLAMSDSGGAVVWRADYQPFGEGDTPSPLNNKAFVGKEIDSESGLHYFGARYMDSSAGRFVAPDPVGAVNAIAGEINQKNLHDPQRINYYTYGLNNPYRYADPDGNSPALVILLGVIGGVVAGNLMKPGVANSPMTPNETTYTGPSNAEIISATAIGTSIGVTKGLAIVEAFAVKASKPVALPDDAWYRDAPKQVAPGIDSMEHNKYNPETRELERSTVRYDSYGRQIERIDYTDHGYPDAHTNPHSHGREYGPGYSPYKKTYKPMN